MTFLPDANLQAEKAMEHLYRHSGGGSTAKDDARMLSDGTRRQYKRVLQSIATWCAKTEGMALEDMTLEQASSYLALRSRCIGQTQLNTEYRVLNALMASRSEYPTVPLNRPASTAPEKKKEKTRAYTDAQIALLASYQSERMSVSIRVADAAGLRAAELLTIARIEECPPTSHPAWTLPVYPEREGWTRYTVKGAHDRVREVRLPAAVAEELEARRRDTPITVHDRRIEFVSRYDIAGGRVFSTQFSKVSKRLLGRSHGSDGLRHSYVERRLEELLRGRRRYPEAIAIISQEIGHIRPDTAKSYLR